MTDNTQKILEEILSSVKNLERRMDEIENKKPETFVSSSLSPSVSKKISIKEFLIEREPKNAVQTTLSIGYWLEKHDNVSTFNIADIERGFRSAKEPVPKNINDKINMCIKNGHIMEAEIKKDNTKAWNVTRSGEQAVEIGFNKS